MGKASKAKKGGPKLKVKLPVCNVKTEAMKKTMDRGGVTSPVNVLPEDVEETPPLTQETDMGQTPVVSESDSERVLDKTPPRRLDSPQSDPGSQEEEEIVEIMSQGELIELSLIDHYKRFQISREEQL